MRPELLEMMQREYIRGIKEGAVICTAALVAWVIWLWLS